MFDRIITLSLNPAIDATLWVEKVRQGADDGVQGEKYESAGKAMNVSRALRIYGVESLALVCESLGVSLRAFFDVPEAGEGPDEALRRRLEGLSPRQRAALAAFLDAMTAEGE